MVPGRPANATAPCVTAPDTFRVAAVRGAAAEPSASITFRAVPVRAKLGKELVVPPNCRRPPKADPVLSVSFRLLDAADQFCVDRKLKIPALALKLAFKLRVAAVVPADNVRVPLVDPGIIKLATV